MEGPLRQVSREQVMRDVMEGWETLVRLERGVFKTVAHMKELT